MMKAISDRGLKIGIIGTDYGHTQDTVTATAMSKYQNATIKATAYGGMVSDDQLIRVGEFGKREAILPLEQPSVMAGVGKEIGAYVGGLTAEQLQAILEEQLYATRESLAVAIDNAAEIIAEEQASSKEAAKQNYRVLSQSLDSWLGSINETLNSGFSGISSDIGKAASSIASSVSSALRSAAMSMGGSSSSSSGSSSGSSSSSKLPGVIGSVIGGAIGGRPGAVIGGIIGGSLKSSGKTKGSASGSLVTKDALYRAGELGLNEAIIPLEKPDIMRYVGSTIASYMPVETQALQSALGMKNAGITAPSPAVSPMQEDMTSLVSDVTQHVLESVLPAMSNMGSSDEAKTPVYVGTLIADERGLKQLERKLYVIRKAEEARRQ